MKPWSGVDRRRRRRDPARRRRRHHQRRVLLPDAARTARLRVQLGARLPPGHLRRRRSSRREQLVGSKALHHLVLPPVGRRRPVSVRSTGCDVTKVVFDPTTDHRPAARPAGRRPPLLPGRQTDRLHRRPDVRPGLDRRRYLHDPVHRRHHSGTSRQSAPPPGSNGCKHEDIGYTARWKGKMIYAQIRRQRRAAPDSKSQPPSETDKS